MKVSIIVAGVLAALLLVSVTFAAAKAQAPTKGPQCFECNGSGGGYACRRKKCDREV